METLVSRFIECLGHWTTSLELAFDEPRLEKWIDVFERLYGDCGWATAQRTPKARKYLQRISWVWFDSRTWEMTAWDGFGHELHECFLSEEADLPESLFAATGETSRRLCVLHENCYMSWRSIANLVFSWLTFEKLQTTRLVSLTLSQWQKSIMLK